MNIRFTPCTARDIVERWRRGTPLNAPDFATFYWSDAKGYTDYPALQTD